VLREEELPPIAHDQVMLLETTPLDDIRDMLRWQIPIAITTRVDEWDETHWEQFTSKMELAAIIHRAQWQPQAPDLGQMGEASITFTAHMLSIATSIKVNRDTTKNARPRCNCSVFEARRERALQYCTMLQARGTVGKVKQAAVNSLRASTSLLTSQSRTCRNKAVWGLMKPLLASNIIARPQNFFKDMKRWDNHGTKVSRVNIPQFFDMHGARVAQINVLDSMVEWCCHKLSLLTLPTYTTNSSNWPLQPRVGGEHTANSAPLTAADITAATRKMRATASPGISGDNPALYKHLGSQATQWLASILNRVWATAVIPGHWLCGKLVPTPKPRKPASNVRNKRPITIMPTILRVYDTVILERTTEVLKKQFPEWPRPWMYGFRKHSSALLEMLTIMEFSRLTTTAKKPIAAVCIDVAGAYDGMKRDFVEKDLITAGIASNLLASIMSFMWGYQYRIHEADRVSCILCPIMGHLQGGPSVPIIWLVHCIQRENALQKRLVPVIPNVLLGQPDISLSQSAFADDHVKLVRAKPKYIKAGIIAVAKGMQTSRDILAEDKNFVILLDGASSVGQRNSLKSQPIAICGELPPEALPVPMGWRHPH
jgi:hypothetical protein